MAWRSSGASNKDLVENLWRNQLITHPEVKAAFLKVRYPFHPSKTTKQEKQTTSQTHPTH